MDKTVESMNIYEKMNAIEDKIGTIPKNLTVGTGRYAYKAVAEKDILAAVKEAEKEYRVFSYPVESRVIDSSMLKKDPDEGAKIFVRIERVYRFVNMDNPEEYVDVKGYGDGIDTLDKAPGKATTYADKYALMKAYKIETGDDLDAHASDDLSGHSIYKIKERIEKLITVKMQNGLAMKDLLSGLGINQKQFDAIMKNAFTNINWLEASLKKL